MLSLMLYIFGVIFLSAVRQVLTEDNLNPYLTDAEKAELISNWGSVAGCMLSPYMAITGGEAYALGEPLKHAGDHFYLLYLFYIAFLSFAVLNVLALECSNRAFRLRLGRICS